MIHFTSHIVVLHMVALVFKIRELMENEMRSCSMDIAGIAPVYVYRMWGGSASLDEIKETMAEVRRW